MMDALSYVDPDYSDHINQIENLITSNKTFPKPQTPIDHPLFEKNPSLKEIYMKSKSPHTSSLDSNRLKLLSPETNNLKDWKSAINNSNAQLEHQHNRIINLELMNTYTHDQWKLYNYYYEIQNNILDVEIQELNKEMEELNKQRKLDQSGFKHQYDLLEGERGLLIDSIVQVNLAISAMKSEINHLESD